MSQDSVYKLLKKNKGWMTTKDIANKSENSRSVTTHNLTKLLKWGDVNKKDIYIEGHMITFWKAK